MKYCPVIKKNEIHNLKIRPEYIIKKKSFSYHIEHGSIDKISYLLQGEL